MLIFFRDISLLYGSGIPIVLIEMRGHNPSTLAHYSILPFRLPKPQDFCLANNSELVRLLAFNTI